jgi:AraC-like DNA-binding protein
MATLEVLLRGMAIGAMLCTALGMLRDQPSVAARWSGALFSLSAAAFALNSGGPETAAVRALLPMIWFLSLGGAGYFWMFAVTLFEDRPFTPIRWAPPAVMTLIGIAGILVPRPMADGIWITHNILEAVLMVHIIGMVWRRRSGDLIEARRALRAPIILLIAVYAIILSAFEISWSFGVTSQLLDLIQAASLATISLLAASAFLQARPELFAAPRQPAADTPADPTGIDPQDRPALARLQAVMTSDELWRRESLTIGVLANEVGIPEHRLRRLINGALGYRNFADFVGARRITAAKLALADPVNARTPISSLAFDLGYASLGPFNRAFKEATGKTPSEWRRQALAGPVRGPEAA